MDAERPNLVELPMPEGYVIWSVSANGTPTYQKRLRHTCPIPESRGKKYIEYWTVVIQLVWDGWIAYLSVYGQRRTALEGYPTACAAAVAAELYLSDALKRN